MARREPFSPWAWTEGLLSAIALTSVHALGLIDLGLSMLAIAAALGGWYAVFSVLPVSLVRHTLSAVTGSVGAIAALVELDAGSSTPGEARLAVIWGLLLLAIALLAFLASFLLQLPSGWDPADLLMWPLTVFGGLEVLNFLVRPLGETLRPDGLGAIGLGLTVIATVLLGVLIGWSPGLALTLFGITILALELGFGRLLDLPEQQHRILSDVSVVVMYFIAFFTVLLVLRRIRLPKTR